MWVESRGGTRYIVTVNVELLARDRSAEGVFGNGVSNEWLELRLKEWLENMVDPYQGFLEAEYMFQVNNCFLALEMLTVNVLNA